MVGSLFYLNTGAPLDGLPKGEGQTLNPHHRPQQLPVGRSAGKVVKRLLRDPNDVVLDERRAFGGAILGMLQAAFPLQHRPAVVAMVVSLEKMPPKST